MRLRQFIIATILTTNQSLIISCTFVPFSQRRGTSANNNPIITIIIRTPWSPAATESTPYPVSRANRPNTYYLEVSTLLYTTRAHLGCLLFVLIVDIGWDCCVLSLVKRDAKRPQNHRYLSPLGLAIRKSHALDIPRPEENDMESFWPEADYSTSTVNLDQDASHVVSSVAVQVA